MDCSDAAHRIHPLAGMGLNLGFGDVKCLTEALAKAAYSGFSLGELAYMILLYISSMIRIYFAKFIHCGSFKGDLTYLNEYEMERLKANVPVMVGVHGLQRLYNTDISPIVLLRSVGLQLTQALSPVKVGEAKLIFSSSY